MKKFKAFKKIGQLKDFYHAETIRQQFVGKDDDGRPIYDKNVKIGGIFKFLGTEKHHGCVAGNTEVLLSDGSLKPIQDIKVGTSVLSYDTEKNIMVNDIVTNVISQNLDKKWVILHFDNGETLKCTEDHLIFTKNRGYIEACQLTENDFFVNYLDDNS